MVFVARGSNVVAALVAWQGAFRLLPSDRPEAKIAIKDVKKDETPAVPVPVPELAIAPFDAKLAAKHQKAWADYLKQPVVETAKVMPVVNATPPASNVRPSAVDPDGSA